MEIIYRIAKDRVWDFPTKSLTGYKKLNKCDKLPEGQIQILKRTPVKINELMDVCMCNENLVYLISN